MDLVVGRADETGQHEAVLPVCLTGCPAEHGSQDLLLGDGPSLIVLGCNAVPERESVRVVLQHDCDTAVGNLMTGLLGIISA